MCLSVLYYIVLYCTDSTKYCSLQLQNIILNLNYFVYSADQSVLTKARIRFLWMLKSPQSYITPVLIIWNWTIMIFCVILATRILHFKIIIGLKNNNLYDNYLENSKIKLNLYLSLRWNQNGWNSVYSLYIQIPISLFLVGPDSDCLCRTQWPCWYCETAHRKRGNCRGSKWGKLVCYPISVSISLCSHFVFASCLSCIYLTHSHSLSPFLTRFLSLSTSTYLFSSISIYRSPSVLSLSVATSLSLPLSPSLLLSFLSFFDLTSISPSFIGPGCSVEYLILLDVNHLTNAVILWHFIIRFFELEVFGLNACCPARTCRNCTTISW